MFSRAGAVIVPALFLSIALPTFAVKSSFILTHHTAQFPNDYYFEGLRNADPGTIEGLYTAFRKPVARAVEAAGGSNADGHTFFRVALIQLAMQAREHQADENIPVFFLLKNLAVTHFRDWAVEKKVEVPDQPPPDEEEAAFSIELPDAEARKQFRREIRARRQFSRLDNDCQKIVQELARDASIGLSDPRLDTELSGACLEKYEKNLGEGEQPWLGTLPLWVGKALSDEHFQKVWSTAEALENRISMGQTVSPQPQSKVTRNVLIALGLMLVVFGIWQIFGRDKSPKMVYEENFQPPASIMADRAARFAKDTTPVERNETCEQLFREADKAYMSKDYTEAANVLYDMLGDDMESCNSEALFYLGIIGLHLNEPEVTMECLAKIQDLDRFGEDLYWYQALAFVKIAAQNPARKGVARRAVERARSNTEIPERREQAEKMLEQLAK